MAAGSVGCPPAGPGYFQLNPPQRNQRPPHESNYRYSGCGGRHRRVRRRSPPGRVSRGVCWCRVVRPGRRDVCAAADLKVGTTSGRHCIGSALHRRHYIVGTTTALDCREVSRNARISANRSTIAVFSKRSLHMNVRAVFQQGRATRLAAAALVACLLTPAAIAAQIAAPPRVEGPAADRMVAEWMLRMGGSIVLEGERKPITDLADLPTTDFRIHTLNFTGITMYAASLQDELRRLP